MVAFQDMIYDNSLILAIIAINMTIIGLTSLAETKRVVGVDYGKFLVRKFKLLYIIRIYHLLVLFAVVNILSLFLMFIEHPVFRLASFLFLVCSLIFAIYYFFSYIIAENSRVRNQIYRDELVGLYYESESLDHQEADVITKMSGGSRTEKKLSNNVIDYFNTYNADSQKAFEDIFGPESMIYHPRKISRYMKKNFGGKLPYQYRREGNIKDISYEYFQLFRSVEHQDKWTLEILRLFGGERKEKDRFAPIRLYNITRVMTHINLFGDPAVIFRYKFLSYLRKYYMDAVYTTRMEQRKYSRDDTIKKAEEYAFIQLVKYTFDERGLQNEYFQAEVRKLFKDLLHPEKNQGQLRMKDKFFLLLEQIVTVPSTLKEETFAEILNEHLEANKEAAFSLQDVKNALKKLNETSEQQKSRITAAALFQ
ncbi:hypothetical protein [Alkalicoccus daliensis]|uniref:Uncharacterized protein n=1 Tax=Alkalicoccus daliensis TaxID=745820 RepID=A0A1H0GFH1_9BACI|nr:hypothetical protein [Alkalicoccus daliensis]SDO05583.1 hypothetical protein SAMN04488053_10687 [Alkalicoccus daliensis]